MFEPIEIIVELADKVSEPAKKAGGAFSELAGEASGVGAAMGGPLAEGAKLGGEVLIGLGVAVVGATIAFAAFGLEQAEVRDKTLAMLSALAGGPAAGGAMLDTIDDLRSSLGMTRKELVPLTQQLLAMGVKAGDVAPKLTALASIKAIGIEGGQEAFLSILKKTEAQVKISSKSLVGLSKTGVSVAEIAAKMNLSVKALEAGLKSGTVSSQAFSRALEDAVTAKGAVALEQQSKSLGAQWALFKEQIGELFEGIDAAPFLDALKEVFGLFDKNTSSGKAMKSGITGAFNGIFRAAAEALPYVKQGIERAIIAGLQLYIAVKENWGTIAIVLKGMAIAAGAVAVVFAILAVAAGVVVVAVAAVAAAFFAGLYTIAGFAVKVGAVLGGWAKDASKYAADFISGLVGGIEDGIGRAVGAAKNLGHSILSAIGLGGQSVSVDVNAAGAPGGAGAPATAPAHAEGGMVTAPAPGEYMASVAPGEVILPKQDAKQATQRGSKSGASAGGAVNVTFAAGSIVIDGAGKSAHEITDTMISLALERIAGQAGLLVAT